MFLLVIISPFKASRAQVGKVVTSATLKVEVRQPLVCDSQESPFVLRVVEGALVNGAVAGRHLVATNCCYTFPYDPDGSYQSTRNNNIVAFHLSSVGFLHEIVIETDSDRRFTINQHNLAGYVRNGQGVVSAC